MKRILIITYHFAPYNNGGAFRALKFVKYLPDSGWMPLVLACSRPLAGFRDEDLANDIPAEAKVWHCPTLGIYKGVVSAANLLARGQRSLRAFFANAEIRLELLPQPNSSNESSCKAPTPGVLDRLLYNLFVPDAMVDWIPVAAAQMRQIIRKYQVDVVMTTSPPHSTHLLGAVLPQRRNLKWIVDLRDPWLDNAVRTHLQNVSKYRQTLESRMEKWIVHHADRVIANTEINRRVLLQRYPALCPDKLAVISNGFDAADLIPSPAFDEKPGKFVATFSGYLYQGMAEPFFRALERLLRNDPALVNRLRVQIIGHYSDYYQREIHSSPHGLAQVIQFLGPMSHRQALAQLQRSDLLLCFNFPTPAAAGVVPSKLYEYFMMAKPILAIGPEGEAAAMIRQANAGQTFTPDQENEIANAMSAFLQRWENGCLHAELNREYVQLFDRRVLTRKLAEICDALFMQ